MALRSGLWNWLQEGRKGNGLVEKGCQVEEVALSTFSVLGMYENQLEPLLNKTAAFPQEYLIQ